MASNNSNNFNTLRKLSDVTFDNEEKKPARTSPPRSPHTEKPSKTPTTTSTTTTTTTTTTKSLDDGDVAISLGGCGFLGVYQLGAIKMIYQHGKKLMDRTVRYAGCSSGSLAAAMLLLCPEKIDEALQNMYDVAEEINNHTLGVMKPGLIISQRLRTGMENVLPQDISKAQNRLYVSVTKLMKLENELISSFESREHLIDVLLASCHHPLWSNGIKGPQSPVLNGENYIDGGYTKLIPTFSDITTVTISAYASDASICPIEKSIFNDDTTCRVMNHNMKISFANLRRVKLSLLPPPKEELVKYYELGAEDAKQFLIRNNVYNE
ncbi:unnamed protein product [Caenorhabditis angaria]|uniref:PNPLA domain-containing protein n=1 Tax=Caenorhabditis angaria TaxID=860376 RepID=A0A9P1IGU3_9PELO|nr:unnamed protein product [Caenorhabditis angaria]